MYLRGMLEHQPLTLCARELTDSCDDWNAEP